MLNSQVILQRRGKKQAVDPALPYDFFIEQECSAAGVVEPVVTLFLTNQECPFRCLYCDLWKYTLDQPLPPGLIPQQIKFALEQLGPAQIETATTIKLYNSGNFFDAQAIPVADHAEIAALLSRFSTVIVENHPKLCGTICAEFNQRIAGRLEIALGLETVDTEILSRLNRQMSLEDFQSTVSRLHAWDIDTRAFVLLKPPFMCEADCVDWAVRSVEFAFDQGVACCSVIPTRGGNGIMEDLSLRGDFSPPSFVSLETFQDKALATARGRVLVDLWEAERLLACDRCRELRLDRARMMNLQQIVLPRIECDCQKQSHSQA